MPDRRPSFYEGRFYATFMDRFQAGLNSLIARQFTPGLRILDAGCGAGNLSLRLAENAREVVGVDLSGPMIAMANERSHRSGVTSLRFLEADITTGLRHDEDGAFDLAVMAMVLHELPHDVRLAALSELARLARRVVLVDFRVPQPWSGAGLRNRAFERAAGRRHFRAFQDFCARGGVPAIAGEAALRCEVLRYVDAETLGMFELHAPG